MKSVTVETYKCSMQTNGNVTVETKNVACAKHPYFEFGSKLTN
jgi:hypothetical protein